MKRYVAMMSTAGISHGGRRYVAMAPTEAEARQALFRKFRSDGGIARTRESYGWHDLANADDLDSFYGILVWQLADGRAIVEED